MSKWGEMSYNKYNQGNYDTEPDVFDNIDGFYAPFWDYVHQDSVYNRAYDEVVAEEEVRAYVSFWRDY